MWQATVANIHGLSPLLPGDSIDAEYADMYPIGGIPSPGETADVGAADVKYLVSTGGISVVDVRRGDGMPMYLALDIGGKGSPYEGVASELTSM